MTNRIAFVLTLVAAVLLLTGCEDGPKCLDYDTQVVSTTTIVNGKVVPGTSIVTICTKYADEGESK
jgi:uncharacterized lipoprotein YajG